MKLGNGSKPEKRVPKIMRMVRSGLLMVPIFGTVL